MRLPEHINRLTGFATQHLNGETGNDYHIRLKLDHTLRVLDNARIIIEEEGVTGHVADLTALAALYHDIGRFPQFARYATFKDADSVNHGRLGVLTLRTAELPGGIPEQDWRQVRAAVGLHNAKTVNPRIGDPLRTMVNITRDADKIDIFPVILDHLGQESGPDKVIIHSLEVSPDKYSRDVYDAAMAGTCSDYGLLRYSNDFILLLIAWLFGLNYATSVRLIAERNLLEQAFALLPDNADIRQLRDKTDSFVEEKRQVSPGTPVPSP